MSVANLKLTRDSAFTEYEAMAKVVGASFTNKRKLTKSLASMTLLWQRYNGAHIAYYTKLQAQAETSEEVLKEISDNHDVLLMAHFELETQGEQYLEEFEEQETGPEPIDPDPNKIHFLKTDLEEKKEQIEARITRINNELGKESFGAADADSIQVLVDRVEADMEQFRLLTRELRDIDAAGENERAATVSTFKKVIDGRMDKITCDLARKVASVQVVPTPAPESTTSAASQVSYKEYQRDAIPSFSGEVREYPDFRREWKECVQPGRPDAWILVNLNKHTPKEVDIRNCENIEEAWKELDSKYGNPTTVSGTLVESFIKHQGSAGSDASKLIEVKTDVLQLYNDLKTVKQEAQLISNDFLLNKIVQRLPREYQKEVSAIRSKEEGGTKTLWNILLDYLKETSRRIETYEPWLLDPKGGSNNKTNKTYKSPQNETRTCRNCLRPGHLQASCPQRISVNNVNVANGPLIRDQAFFEARRQVVGSCPECGEEHLYRPLQGQNAGYDLPSDGFKSCAQFLRGDTEAKAEIIARHSACAICLRWSHDRTSCKRQKPCGRIENGVACPNLHSPLLHGSSIAFVNLTQTPTDSGAVLLQVFPYTFEKEKIQTVALADPGSTTSIILNGLADSLKLPAVEKPMLIFRAGLQQPERMKVKEYMVPLKIPGDSGEIVRRKLIGLDWIASSDSSNINLDEIYPMFPHLPKGSLERPKGKIGLLIGQDLASLLPSGGEGPNLVGDLRVLNLNLGQGYVLAGRCPGIPNKQTMSQQAAAITNATLVVEDSEFANMNHIKCREPNFLECEELAVTVPKKCARCLGCQNCSVQGLEISRKEAEELKMLRESVTLDTETKTVTATYPVVGDLSKLRNNKWQAIKMAENLEKRLLKSGKNEAYNGEFDAFVKRGVLKEVSEDQVKEWESQGNAVNFISHHGVESNSSSTPLRLVSNSSLRNCGRGPSVNELWAKGPNSLNGLYDVFLRWRTYEVGLVFDIRKAYHNIRTTEKETFLRLLVWRNCDTQKPFKIYGYTVVAFGDTPASVLLEVAKEMLALNGREIDPIAAEKILSDLYVDDALTGGSESEVETMRGDLVVNEGELEFSGTIPLILAQGGMSVKAMIRSGEKDKRVLQKLGGPVLGHDWDPSKDTISFNLPITIRLNNSDISLRADNLEEVLSKYKPSKRNVLSIVNGFYDPTGVLAPLMMKLKLFMREVVSLGLEWDDDLPPALAGSWKSLLEELTRAETIVIPRCVRPTQAAGIPELVMFSDGSGVGYGAVIYIRWRLGSSDNWSVRLLTAKSKVAPLTGITAPRSELNALLLGTRLLDSVLRALQGKVGKVFLLVDSMCTISSVETRTTVLAPYFANRVSEFLLITASWKVKYPEVALESLAHIPGELNIADMLTRGRVSPLEVAEGTSWQAGPPFLRHSPDRWPTSTDFTRELPEGEVKQIHALQALDDSDPKPVNRLIDVLGYSDNLETVRGTLARLIRASQLKRKEEIRTMPSVEDYKRADFLMLLLSQQDVLKMLEKMKGLASIMPFRQGHIWWTRGRFGLQLSRALGPDKIPILPHTCRLAELMMIKCHRQNHLKDPGDALFRSRAVAWIVNGRSLAKKVVRECKWCQGAMKQMLVQQMGPLPLERVEIPCRPFTHVAVDLLGPYLVKSMANPRTSMKTWPIVFCCLNTGAVHIELSHTYGTDSFLLQYSNFTSLRGNPVSVYSDRGTQLVKASSYVAGESPDTWEWAQVREHSSRAGTTWRYTPAGCQFRNGMAESRVKSLKIAMKTCLSGAGDRKLNYAEMRALLSRCANIMNNRPLGVRAHNKTTEEILPITPNLILLGRSDMKPDLRGRNDEDEDSKFTVRYDFVRELESVWWNGWYRQCFDSMLPFNKWKEKRRNLEIGDLCLLREEGKVGVGEYRVCKVVQADEDSDGLVRTVSVEMRPRDKREKALPYDPKTLVKFKTAVNRLSLLQAVEKSEFVGSVGSQECHKKE